MILNPSVTDTGGHIAAGELALHLAAAENALRVFTMDKVDAIVDRDGMAYLLRPAQEQLMQNERWLDSVLESTADLITVVSRSGAIVSQSRPVNRLLGYEQHELVGTSIFQHIREEDVPAVHAAFFNVVEGLQEHATAQFSHRARDGSYRMVEATMGKLRDCARVNVVLSLRPIDSAWRRGIEFKLREEEEKAPLPKDWFLAMLSHELRTPLMPVLLCIGELQEDERFAEARPMLAIMQRNIKLQAGLLEELADFTSVGHHKVRLRMEKLDVNEAIRFVLEICQGEIAASGVEVRLDLMAADHIVLADTLRLQQVMWNLLRNAIKFSPSGSGISITSTNKEPGTILLEFVDHGTGIEAELLPLIFNPFQQGEGTAKEQRHGGLGLGMFIAKGLTEAQEGTLTVSSPGRGFGMTFSLTLKLAHLAADGQATLPLSEPKTLTHPGGAPLD